MVFRIALLVAASAAAIVQGGTTKKQQVKDFTKQVEVVVNGRLRETSPGQGEVGVSVWNKSVKDISGPIFLVVDGTGIDSVKVGSHEEETAAGKAVFQVVAGGIAIPAGAMTETLQIAFKMPAGMSRDDANAFHLTARVFAQDSPTNVARAQNDDSDFATKGKSYNQAELDAAIAAQRAATPGLMKNPDVFGTAITEDSKGNLAIRVYTDTRSAAKSLPGTVNGLPVDVKVIPGRMSAAAPLTTVIKKGGIAESKATRDAAQATSKTAAAGKAAGAKPSLVVDVDQQARFDRPVPIGISAFNAQTTSGGQTVCATGTLGFRCIDSSGKLYALSNAHVFSDHGYGSVGEVMVQPGQLDNGCNPDIANNTIGTLVDSTRYVNDITTSRFYMANTIPMNMIDAALSAVSNALDPQGNTVPAVGFATPSDGYGAPSNRVLPQNRLGLQVQKYGRTTGYTRGFTTAMGIFAPITGSPVSESADFYRIDEFYSTDPGLVSSPSTPFGGAGDSGSLIVTLADRRPVSLLFAGSDTTGATLGCLIHQVLDRFNVRVDNGQNSNATTTGNGTEGLGARQGIAFGNITGSDIGTVVVTDSTGAVIQSLLPPELISRLKHQYKPLVPVHNGRGS